MAPSFFSRGGSSIQIPFSMHLDHRRRLVAAMTEEMPVERTAVLLQGGEEVSRYDSDLHWEFRHDILMKRPLRKCKQMIALACQL